MTRHEWEIEGDWHRDGAVCVRRAFGREYLELAREAIDANLTTLSPRAKRASADGDLPEGVEMDDPRFPVLLGSV